MIPSGVAGALAHAVAVVQAPAGYGKTAVVRAAVAEEPAVAWYDAQPWEQDAFVAPLVASLRPHRPDAGRVALSLANDGAPMERVAAALATELAHVAEPLRIVVDDAHVLGNGFAAFARALWPRMPQSVRLVLVARSPLDVALPEAIAAGRGALVDANALRLDAAGARVLARELDVDVDERRTAAIVARTEGWPIAVTLALRTGSDALLGELVAGRLAALGNDARALLESVVAYEVVEPEIAAPGDRAFARALVALGEDGTVATVTENGVRVHPLVRDALLRALDPETVRERHRSAAAAYARAGRPRAALHHLERAGDAESDRAFLRAHAAEAVSAGLGEAVRAAYLRVRAAGDDPALEALVDGLLAKTRGEDPRAHFARAHDAAVAAGDDDVAFEAALLGIEAALARGETVPADAVEALLARAARRGDRMANATVRAGWSDVLRCNFPRALARLETLAGDAALGDAAPLAAYAHLALGEFEAAERVANAAIERLSGSDDVLGYAGALQWAARFALLRGDTAAAYELAREGERIARPFAVRAHAAADAFTLAEAALHAGDLETARRAARNAQRLADAAWYARDAARARILGARILARADALDATATAAFDANDPIATSDAAAFAALHGSSDARSRVAAARAALATETIADAADAVALWSAHELLDFVEALDGRDTRTLLEGGPFAALLDRRREVMRLGTLGRLLHDARQDARKAVAFRDAFARVASSGTRYELAVVERFAATLGAQPVAPPAPAPLETLTAREAEILTLLAGGLTNREIAQRLVLSTRTVETHVARVTGKLGVNSRARAVARAVALGLVAPAAEIA